MKGKIGSVVSAFALVFALAMAPLSAAWAEDHELDMGSFDVLDDSDSDEEGTVLELDDSEDSEDVDSEDVDSEDADSEDVDSDDMDSDSDSDDIDSEDSDGDPDDSDSEDDSEDDSDDDVTTV